MTSLGLSLIFGGQTHQGHCLDKIFASENVYTSTFAFDSLVFTKHKAVVATAEIFNRPKKVVTVHRFRRRTPTFHATFLDYLKDFSWSKILDSQDAASAFSSFYKIINELLDCFYPYTNISTTSRDPPFVTPEIKYLLRCKNKLMRKGKTEAAACLADKIKNKIVAHNASSFAKPCTGPKDLWERVNKITDKEKINFVESNQFNADVLNNYYASVSTDQQYAPPDPKSTAPRFNELITEAEVFRLLDAGRSTAAGMDGLPFWFLRVAAPSISSPLAHLFNLSLSYSFVAPQWKVGVITPVPKVPSPFTCSDFRPITGTPIVSRILEKIVVRHFVYPVFIHENTHHLFQDQFTYRPTGSSTAAVICLLYRVSELLLSNPFVHIIALDFSRAFDTVRHSTLMQKLSNFPIPDHV